MRLPHAAYVVAACGFLPAAASAAELHQLDLPAGRLGNALVALGRQTGTSIGISDAALAEERVGSVRGRLTLEDALRQLLRGKSAQFVRIDGETVRVVRRRSSPARAKPVRTPPRLPLSTPVRPVEPDSPPEEIIVTGSRIQRPEVSSESTLVAVEAEQIALAGTTTLETLLNDLPQVVPGNNRTSNNAGGFPFATVDLRGLGPARTLVLVDGERLPASSSLGVVDASQIPIGLIERVEVVTGGASAVYGSDAMAGLVNFILRKDFEGFELTGQSGIAEVGVGPSHAVSGLFGGEFAGGRGNVMFYASYFARDEVDQSRFEFSRISQAIYYDPATSSAYPVDSYDDIRPGSSVLFGGGSLASAAGIVQSGGFRNLSTVVGGEFRNQDTDCNPATPGVDVSGGTLTFDPATGALQPYNGSGRCSIPVGNSSRYNYAPANFLTIPYQRFNMTSTARYELTDGTRLDLFGSFTDWTSRTQLAPTPALGELSFTIDPRTANFIPADLRAALATRPDRDAPFSFGRRFMEAGPRLSTTESQAFVGRITLEHELGAGWLLAGDVGWGRTDLTSYRSGNINRVAVEQGINGCVDGAGLMPGCVPVDIFGANTLTPDMLAFIRADTIDTGEFEQVRASLNLTGSLLQLQGGPVGLAIGVEMRKDRGQEIVDDARQRGEIIGFNAVKSLRGQIAVNELYGEIRLPILGGAGFPDLLAVELGARYSDYSSLDGLFNWKAAVEFAPVPWARFRGAYNKAARAPNIVELFRAGDQGAAAYVDPCNAPIPGNPDYRPLRCAADVPPAFYPAFQQSSHQVQSFAFGQPDLDEERAETYTAGLVLTPARFPFGRMSLTADYYNIRITNRIGALGAQFYLNQCYAVAPEAAACARIFRNPATGQVVRIDTGLENSAVPLQTSGIDLGISWAASLAGLFGGALGNGRIRLSELFSHTIDYRFGRTDYVDTVGFNQGAGYVPISSWSSILTAGYEQDRFAAQLRWTYKSGGSQEGTLFGPDIIHGRIPDLSVFDLSLRWDVDDRLSLTAIVDNIFDKFPPQTITGSLEQSNTNAAFYSPLFHGRSYAVQAKVRF